MSEEENKQEEIKEKNPPAEELSEKELEDVAGGKGKPSKGTGTD